jgi:hypothetical protein
MIIKAKTARQLIAAGKAGNASFVWDDGVDHQLTQPKFVSIDRYDLQRTDHFEADEIAISEWKNA